MYRYTMLTAASYSASGLSMAFLCLALHIGNIWLYMHICRAYMHIWSLENIFVGLKYMFSMFVCIYACCMLYICK